MIPSKEQIKLAMDEYDKGMWFNGVVLTKQQVQAWTVLMELAQAYLSDKIGKVKK